MLTIEQLREEMIPWTDANFGTREAWQPELGMIEELGELAHAYLKMRQGIRGTEAEHLEAIKDAIGDFIIYWSDWVRSAKMEYHVHIHSCTFHDIQDTVFDIPREFRRHREPIEVIKDWLQDLASLITIPHQYGYEVIYDAAALAQMLGFDLQEIVETTWNTVKQRNWKANPKDGITA